MTCIPGTCKSLAGRRTISPDAAESLDLRPSRLWIGRVVASAVGARARGCDRDHEQGLRQLTTNSGMQLIEHYPELERTTRAYFQDVLVLRKP